MRGGSEFERAVGPRSPRFPYGEMVTYGSIADRARRSGRGPSGRHGLQPQPGSGHRAVPPRGRRRRQDGRLRRRHRAQAQTSRTGGAGGPDSKLELTSSPSPDIAAGRSWARSASAVVWGRSGRQAGGLGGGRSAGIGRSGSGPAVAWRRSVVGAGPFEGADRSWATLMRVGSGAALRDAGAAGPSMGVRGGCVWGLPAGVRDRGCGWRKAGPECGPAFSIDAGVVGGQRSMSPRMNASTDSLASWSLYWTGGDFMK